MQIHDQIIENGEAGALLKLQKMHAPASNLHALAKIKFKL